MNEPSLSLQLPDLLQQSLIVLHQEHLLVSLLVIPLYYHLMVQQLN